VRTYRFPSALSILSRHQLDKREGYCSQDVSSVSYKRDQVSLGRAAEIAELSAPQFLAELGRRRTPINYEAADLQADLKTLQGLP
jgi:predicted HTH domain antitoxin